MRKKICSIGLLAVCLLSALSFTGCVDIKMDEEQEALVVEYAVNAVINHDKNYIIKMADRKPEPETTTGWVSEGDKQETETSGDTSNQSGQSGQNSGVNGSTGNTVSVNQAFSFGGFNVESTGYEIVDKYPGNNAGFSMIATKGFDLLVVKFKVTNTAAAEQVLDVVGMDYSYRCNVNGDTKVNAQVTALLNAMNTWNKPIGAGASEEMILVFQVKEEISDNVQNITLSVIKDGVASTTVIK